MDEALRFDLRFDLGVKASQLTTIKHLIIKAKYFQICVTAMATIQLFTISECSI